MYFKTKLCQIVSGPKNDPRLESGLRQGLILCLNTKNMYGAQLSGYIGSARAINWTGREIHLHLVPSLRISRAIPLFPLYAVMAWMETASPFESHVLFFMKGIKHRKHPPLL